MKSIESLKRIYKIEINIPQWKFPSDEGGQKIHDAQERLENLFAMPILNFLFERNYKKLLEIENRLNKNTSLYLLAKFAASLCADETDFEFLTNPENLENYKKLKELSEKLDKKIPGYVNVLQRICDNKLLGLYSEFQEVGFFFDEVGNTENFKIVFEYYKRILKLQTQKIFQEFITIDFFKKIPRILFKYKNKIRDENSLVLFIYGELFFTLGLSNEHENVLLKHIDFCVQHLLKSGNIIIEKFESQKYFSESTNLYSRLNLFFQFETFDTEKKLIPFLKDYSLNDNGVVLFCNELKRILNGDTIFLTFTPSVNIFKKSVSLFASDNEGIIFLQSLFKVAHNGAVSLREIKMYRYSEVLKHIVNGHFFKVKEDERKETLEKILVQYKKLLGVYFDSTKFLLQNNVFEKIIFTYHHEKQIGKNDYEYVLHNAEIVASNYSNFSDKGKLIDIISVLYSIVIEKMKLHFEVGSKVYRKQDGYGTVIQIVEEFYNGKEIFCYRIIWDKSEKLSRIPVEDVNDIELADL